MSSTTSQPASAYKDPCTAWEMADLAIRLAMLKGTDVPDFARAKSCIENSLFALIQLRKESEERQREFDQTVADGVRMVKEMQDNPTLETKALKAVSEKFGNLETHNYPITEAKAMLAVMGKSGKNKARRREVLFKAYRHSFPHKALQNLSDEAWDNFLSRLFPLKDKGQAYQFLKKIAPFVPIGKRATKVPDQNRKTGQFKKRKSLESPKSGKVEDRKRSS
jgi:hypothetical protein